MNSYFDFQFLSLSLSLSLSIYIYIYIYMYVYIFHHRSHHQESFLSSPPKYSQCLHKAERNICIRPCFSGSGAHILFNLPELFVRLVGCLVVWALWHINLCRSFHAKSIFMKIVLFKTIPFSISTRFQCKYSLTVEKHFFFKLFSLFKWFKFS